MAVLIDSYSETNAAGAFTLPTDISIVGQSFNSAGGGTLNSAKFYMAKTGTPPGNIVAKVYAHTGTYGSTGKPTGSALATSDNVAAASLTADPTWGLVTFTFSGGNKITLTASTKYCVIIEYTAGSGGNIVGLGFDNTSPSHGGNLVYWTGAAWDYDVAYDNPFYVYVDDAAGAIKDIIGGFIPFPR